MANTFWLEDLRNLIRLEEFNSDELVICKWGCMKSRLRVTIK